MREKSIFRVKEKKYKKYQTGTITPTKDFFKFKSKNIGVFPKPKIERKDNNKWKGGLK